jgi:ADP-ribose pyrophosphatase YjhB (NUDIX family)
MLRTVPTARYTELNTLFVESGHFRYHLQQLIKEGLIVQPTRGQYALSQKGMHAVDKLSLHAHNTTPMPKVITYTLLTSGNSVVLQQKQKEPYMHLYNMIGGKVHEGETTQQAAVREVQEKTGLAIADPQHKGIYEIFIRQNNTLLSHTIAYVYTAEISNIQCELLMLLLCQSKT